MTHHRLPSVSLNEFDHLLVSTSSQDGLQNPNALALRHEKVALAVSGGRDSTCLMYLFSLWRAALKKHKPNSAPGTDTVLTVNHGLRPHAAKEAKHTAIQAKKLGFAHKTLHWNPTPPPSTAVQEKARHARYALMFSWCATHNIKHLLLAHHGEDQIETFLMRLFKGSGVDGLAAMGAQTQWQNIYMHRPFLTLPRARLTATLKKAGIPWLEDDTNTDLRYLRPRLRKLTAYLQKQNLPPDNILLTIRRMARARAALQEITQSFILHHTHQNASGAFLVQRAELQKVPFEIVFRVLQNLLQKAGRHDKPLRQKSLERLCHDILRPESICRGRTLAQCKIIWNTNKHTKPYVSISALTPPNNSLHTAKKS